MNKLLVIPLILLIGAILSGCGGGQPAAPSEQEIRIGACESATGMFSGFSAGGRFGLKAAVDDVNKLGGVYLKEYGRKLPVKLIMMDNQSDPIKAGTLAESLILQDKVNFLVSGNESPPAFASTALTNCVSLKLPSKITPI